MGKIIVLEGPDGAGKTTLGKHLQDHHGYKYHHEGIPPRPDGPDSLLNYYGQLLYDAHNGADNVVFDRLHFGEAVYGPICRNVDQLGDLGITLIQRLIMGYGSHLVLCLPFYDVCRQNWLIRKGLEYVPDEDRFERIYKRYEFLYDKHMSEIFWYNYKQMDITQYGHVLAHDNTLHLPKGVIGNPHAKFIFVGEIANQQYLDLPFFSLKNSTQYLNSCIFEAGFTEREICFTNALMLDYKPRDLKHIVTEMRLTTVYISLGKTAGEQLALVNPLFHHRLHHPAYFKRFHSHRRSEYVKQLREIRDAYCHHGVVNP